MAPFPTVIPLLPSTPLLPSVRGVAGPEGAVDQGEDCAPRTATSTRDPDHTIHVNLTSKGVKSGNCNALTLRFEDLKNFSLQYCSKDLPQQIEDKANPSSRRQGEIPLDEQIIRSNNQQKELRERYSSSPRCLITPQVPPTSLSSSFTMTTRAITLPSTTREALQQLGHLDSSHWRPPEGPPEHLSVTPSTSAQGDLPIGALTTR